MRVGFLNMGLFIKNSKAISEKNKKSLSISGIVFIAVSLIELLVYFFTDTENIPLFVITYDLLIAAGLVVLRSVNTQLEKASELIGVAWFVLGYAFVCNTGVYHNDSVVIINYFVIAVSLSAVFLTEPMRLTMLHFVGLVAISLTSYLEQDYSWNPAYIAKCVTVFIFADVIGILATNLRMENLIFERDMFYFTEEEDNEFVETYGDGAWRGRNKYGIISGKNIASRRVFTFVLSVSKGRVVSINRNNVFNLKSGDDWDEVRTVLLGCALDPASRKRLSRMFDSDTLLQLYRTGKRRATTIAGFEFAEYDKKWLDIECVLRAQPITGEIFATVVVEDITEERILMGILNKIVEQNYDYVMCIPKGRANTIMFKVNKGEEIAGEYGPFYSEIVEDYIKNRVHEHDREKAEKVMTLKTVIDGLREQEKYEFLLDETDSEGNTRKKLFQYSYLDPNHNFMSLIKQDVSDVISKEDKAKAELSKALTDREEAMNAQADFMTRMSHEMRTPMNAILGLSNLMMDEINHPEAMRDYIRKVEYSGQFLLQLINDVLDITRMQQGDFVLNSVPYTFKAFWESIDVMIGPMALKKGVDFEWKSSIPESCVIITDPLRVTQLCVNLLSNAVKYTPKGGRVYFECKAKELDATHGRFTIIVQDNGIGMSEEFQKEMFVPFHQESKDVNSELNGTGLGLAIVKKIVDAFGGTITVESTKGVGTKFTVTFVSEVTQTQITETEKVPDKDLTGKRILVVEDNDINREIAVAILEKRGMITDIAVNGQEAVDQFASHTPGYYDLILMDIRMPIMSGLTATKRIRAMERDDAATIPILAMTANAFGKDVAASLEAGLNEHLSKPIDPKLLYATISKYV